MVKMPCGSIQGNLIKKETSIKDALLVINKKIDNF